MVINPEEAAAGEADRLLKFPSATKVETFSRGRAELVKFIVTKNLRICDKALRDIPDDLKKQVIISVVSRDNEVFIPDGNFILRAGDEITILESSRNTLTFFRKAGREHLKSREDFVEFIEHAYLLYPKYIKNLIITKDLFA